MFVMVTASKMANAFVKEVQEDSEENRPNLLGVIEDRNRSLNKVSALLFISLTTYLLVVINHPLFCKVLKQDHRCFRNVARRSCTTFEEE